MGAEHTGGTLPFGNWRNLFKPGGNLWLKKLTGVFALM